MARAAVFLFAGFLVASSAFAQVPRRQPNTTGPSALESHAARLEHDAVQDLKDGKPSSGWFVDLDLVFSGDKEEYEAVGKYGLMVFALFSSDQTQLPLAHAYVGGVELKCLPSVSRDVPSDSATAKAFGKFRADTLCLLPLDLEHKSNRISIDFAKSPKGLEVSSFALEEPDFMKADTDLKSNPTPDPVMLQNFVNREYPGFGFQVQP